MMHEEWQLSEWHLYKLVTSIRTQIYASSRYSKLWNKKGNKEKFLQHNEC